MTKKPKVLVRIPGRPFAELIDPEYAAEIARMREETNARYADMVGLERRERERLAAESREAIAKAKASMARVQPICDAYKRRVMARAKIKLAERE